MVKSENNFNDWQNCKNILCVRSDNLGDVLMSSSAIRALKTFTQGKITLLCSSTSAVLLPFLDCIDDSIIFDFPWVKNNSTEGADDFLEIVKQLSDRQFDAAVIFTVYSQSPLPAAMLMHLSGIPKILAYCRENPYALINCWVPEQEPYSFIQHQVQRDLNLVAEIGARIEKKELTLKIPASFQITALQKLRDLGIDPVLPWIILHPGVSEEKRRYGEDSWIEIGIQLARMGYQIVLTGNSREASIADKIVCGIDAGACSLAGKCSFGEFATLIGEASLVISVNTSTIHVAAAMDTPLIVLYALTNPQHLPWRARGIYLPFEVPETLQSKNEVIRFASQTLVTKADGSIDPFNVVEIAAKFLSEPDIIPLIPEIIP